MERAGGNAGPFRSAERRVPIGYSDRMRMLLIVGLALSACSTAGPPLSPPPQASVRRPNLPAAAPDSRVWHSRVPTDSTITYLPAPPAGSEPLADVLGAPAILSPAGYSRIPIGAKLAEVQERYALDTAMEKDFDDRCRLYWTPYVPGLTVYVQNGVVTRVSVHHVRLAADVWVPPAVRTVSRDRYRTQARQRSGRLTSLFGKAPPARAWR